MTLLAPVLHRQSVFTLPKLVRPCFRCLMPALKWLPLLMNHIPDKHEQLVWYYGYYSNRSRGARKQAKNDHDIPAPLMSDEPTIDARRNASWARLMQKLYELDPLECPNCGATMRIIALIEDANVVERITPAGPHSGR